MPEASVTIYILEALYRLANRIPLRTRDFRRCIECGASIHGVNAKEIARKLSNHAIYAHRMGQSLKASGHPRICVPVASADTKPRITCRHKNSMGGWEA